ncbi:choline-binding transcriptional repressor BetI [Leisingera sp. ANG-Vp]|uniref:choline-binding transcriptional repressor BetI n=1 Tax=Leisingera sp. ANG-Vp TaxID=1577896 RepID=UPI0005806C5C|nr:transcriptional regulator BetI [Leisingera sp. ANG-Vp]KIC20151.1 BetI family transcriptional regulator [Leisingera sp. ANG-Vp]
MPKLGMEPKRRAALVDAVIDEIGEAGSLDVTVSKIAKRAGMSSGLAHHYFGSKDQMLIAAMRHILTIFSQRVIAGLADAEGPAERIKAIIRANFEDHVFERRKTSAWLSFYALSQSNEDAAHLMEIYQKRLRSNLLHDLRKTSSRPEKIERTLSALIDGVYLRAALGKQGPDPLAAETVILAFDALLARQ